MADSGVEAGERPRPAELKRMALPFTLVLAAMLAIVIVAYEIRMRRVQRRYDLDLAVQRTAVARFPIVAKFLRPYPDARLIRPFKGLPESTSYLFCHADAELKEIVICRLPVHRETEDGVKFNGLPVVETGRLVADGHAGQYESQGELSEADLDAVIRARAEPAAVTEE